jgi:3-oxoadipate enol-lactonase
MFAEANGIRIHYELSGKKGGPVVILSHSLGSNVAMWEPQLPALEPHFQLLRYDVRGHGASDAPEGPYTLEMLAQDVVGLLDLLKMEKVHFVGLSMGGMIGQHLALSHPQRLRSLVLCDTAALVPQDAQPLWRERIATARERGMEALVDSTLERWFTPSFLKGSSPMLATIRKAFLATPVEGYIGASEAIRRLNTLERLSEIKVPTLIMVGEDDPGTPVAASEAMHSRIQSSKLVVLPDCRHLSNVEQAALFNQHLLSFLMAH